MIPITRADEELFSTLVMASRLGRAEAIVSHLAERYDKEWDNPVAGFPYALSMFAALQSGRADLQEHFDYTEIVETLSDVLYNQPDHWLGRFLRIHVRTLLPTDAQEHRAYIAAERGRAVEDAEELVERQSGSGWQPWFAWTHLMAARLTWESDRDPDRVAALVSAAAARTVEPVRFHSLGSIGCEAFLWYHHESGLPHQDTVLAMMGTLFPDQPAVRRIRADSSP
jgi:hypothetical protein